MWRRRGSWSTLTRSTCYDATMWFYPLIVLFFMIVYIYALGYVAIVTWLGWTPIAFVLLAVGALFMILFLISYARAWLTSPGQATPTSVVVTVQDEVASTLDESAPLVERQMDDVGSRSSGSGVFDRCSFGNERTIRRDESTHSVKEEVDVDTSWTGSEVVRSEAGEGGESLDRGSETSTGDGSGEYDIVDDSVMYQSTPQGESTEGGQEGVAESPGEEPAVPDPTIYCSKCVLYKPPRTHHCRRCDKCVLRMDHHCHWINNCVGVKNHKFFFLTVSYAWLGASYALLLCTIRWATLLVPVFESMSDVGFVDAWDAYDLGIFNSVALGIGLLVAINNFGGMTYMFSFHCFLISHGRTNVEHVCCKGVADACDFDLGSAMNWEHLMGKNMLLWPIPTPPESASNDPWYYYHVKQMMHRVNGNI